MPKLSAISRLLSGLKREHHDYKPSLHIFPELNSDKLASDLQLEMEATQRGKRNEPPADSTAMDDFELRIVDRIESEKNTAHNTFSEEVRVYAERLAALEFEERFSAIRHAAPAAVSEFKVEVGQGRDELFNLRRNIIDVEKERDKFRKKHGIERLSRHASGGTLTLKFGILVLLTLIEIVMNGYFLSKGSEGGMFGGINEAVSFAILNVVVSFLVAAVGVRWINHRNFFAKLIGLLSLAFYLCFAIGLNLSLAHFREISGALNEDASREVITRMLENPLGLTDLKSWIFFAIGLTFSAIAFGDAFLIYDPYPGFGSLYQRVEKEHETYRATKDALIKELKAIRDEAIETMEEAGRDLSKRRGAYDSFMQGRERLNQLFIGYQDHLDRTVNTLLAMYREANSKARTDGKVPERFRKRYDMKRLPIPKEQGLAMARDDLRRSIVEAQELLNMQVAAIHTEFSDAVSSYDKIDDIVSYPENDHGTPQLKVA
ncbi:hypothetical protein BB934_45650 (plasmid) [Microvirga ossetica]|uniref:Transmembrane protein n=1 Tax=Microvirga ossetica TaxID=1882682 RepID=A0A1B2F030_9HYPH|nr:hypothetical protein [Microvirga ossetica]ANY85507.1 hypothetical protein BB934_45650 [Microvirga ossetica]